jgi:hypothetical protein
LEAQVEAERFENSELDAIIGLGDAMVWEALQELLNGCIIDVLQEEGANIFKSDGLHLIGPPERRKIPIRRHILTAIIPSLERTFRRSAKALILALVALPLRLAAPTPTAVTIYPRPAFEYESAATTARTTLGGLTLLTNLVAGDSSPD